MRGSEEDRRVRARLVSAPQNGLTYELLIEPGTVLEVDLPAHVRVLAVDLADVRDAGTGARTARHMGEALAIRLCELTEALVTMAVGLCDRPRKRR